MLWLFAGATARHVARLIRDRPYEWSDASSKFADEQFRIVHVSDLCVWVANGSWGIHLETPKGQLWDVTAWCLIGGSPNQQCVWRAYKKWAKAHPFKSAPDVAAWVRSIP